MDRKIFIRIFDMLIGMYHYCHCIMLTRTHIHGVKYSDKYFSIHQYTNCINQTQKYSKTYLLL